jgi:NADH-quinone oxidoreductase subunit F
LRLKAQAVQVLYRRTREEMPAYQEEVEEAIREGVQFEFLTAPKEIIAVNGKVGKILCSEMELSEFDQSGRRRPLEKPDTDYTLEADQVVAAIGQTLTPGEIFGDLTVKLRKNNSVMINPVTGQTSLSWLFAGGDAVTGPSSVIEAIAAGEKAAVGMDEFLTGASHQFWRQIKTVDTKFDPDADPVPYSRAETPLVPPEKRKHNFREVELCWSRAVALGEAKRCLRCDYREPVEK